jgi:putative DNA primase/helicase
MSAAILQHPAAVASSSTVGAPASIEKIQSALSAISPEDRDVWVKMAMAIRSELGEAGEWIWQDWSQGAESYHELSAKSVWRGIKANGKVGIGSLFFAAKQSGWTWSKPEKKLSAAELEAVREASRIKAEAAAAEKLAEQVKVAANALAIWNAAIPATTHPYLIRKKVAAHGIRFGAWKVTDHETGEVRVITPMALIVPIKDRTGKIWSLQAIMPNGSKLFLAGGAKAGRFFPIGKPNEHDGRKVFVIDEGFSTGASLHDATGHCVLVCFDAGNILAVASALRERQPDAIILFAADDDRFTKRKDGTPYNPGVEAATKAAKAVGGLIAIPQFASLDGQPTDFNDLYLREGKDAVAAQINAALAGTAVVPGEDDAPGTDAGEVLAADAGEVETQDALQVVLADPGIDEAGASPAQARHPGSR